MVVNRIWALAFFVSLAACSGSAVPESDKAAQALEAGDIEAAKEHIRNALKENGATADLKFLQGRIALEDDNPELAKTAFADLLEHPQLGTDSRVYLAQAYMMLGNGKLALETLGESEPANGLASAIAVSALLIEDEVEEANAMLDRGLEKFPDTPELLILEGTRTMQLGDVAGASAIATRAAKLAPNDADVALFQAKVALQRRDLKGANSHFDRVLEIRPGNQVAMLGKAAIAYDNGERNEALKWLKDASEQVGGAGAPLILLNAQIAYDDGNYEEANRIIQGFKDFNYLPEAYRLSGLIAAKRGQREQALSQLTAYFRRGGDDAGARAVLAGLLSQTGRHDEAWEYIRPIADAPNANAQTLALASSIAQKLNLPSAESYRARAQRLAQGDPNAKQMVAADKAMRVGNWKEAEAIYAKLLTSPGNANNVVIVNNYANVLLQNEKDGEAVRYARQAYKIAPSDPTVRDTLGWAMFQAEGYSTEALGHLRFAAEARPGSETIRSHYVALAAAAPDARR